MMQAESTWWHGPVSWRRQSPQQRTKPSTSVASLSRCSTSCTPARLFRMLYPRSVGGDEVEPATYIDAVGELARADGSVGWCVSIANSIGLFAPYLDLDAARTVFGDPRSTCAWGPPNDCRGIAVPNGYRVSGRWDFAAAAGTRPGWAHTARSSNPTAHYA